MKIIFEYEDGTYRIVTGLKLSKIADHLPENTRIDILVSDMGQHPDYHVENPLINKYIVADDNRLAGFTGHTDIMRLRKEIDDLENQIDLKEHAIKMCQREEDLVAYEEKINIPRTAEEKAVDEIFEYAENRDVYTN